MVSLLLFAESHCRGRCGRFPRFPPMRVAGTLAQRYVLSVQLQVAVRADDVQFDSLC